MIHQILFSFLSSKYIYFKTSRCTTMYQFSETETIWHHNFFTYRNIIGSRKFSTNSNKLPLLLKNLRILRPAQQQGKSTPEQTLTISLIPLTLQHFKLFKVVVTSQLVKVLYKVAFQFWTAKHRSSQMRLFDLLGFRQISNFPHSCCNLNVIEFDCEIIFE